MVYRRVIQLSPTTKVVSLPSRWLSANKVKKGDYVNIEDSGNKIIIETTKSGNKSMSSDLTSLRDTLLWTAIDSFYMLGYSHIELKLTVEQKKLMNKIVKYFPMLMIASETKTALELNTVSDNLDMDFDKTIQHVRHITNNIVDEALSLIEIKDWETLAKIKKMDYDLNIYISVCFRHLNSGKIANAISWAQFVKMLELYSDRLCIMFKQIADSKSCGKIDIDAIKRIRNLYDDSFKLLDKFTIQKANEHEEDRRLVRLSSEKSSLYNHFYELTQSIYDIHEIIFQLHHDI